MSVCDADGRALREGQRVVCRQMGSSPMECYVEEVDPCDQYIIVGKGGTRWTLRPPYRSGVIREVTIA